MQDDQYIEYLKKVAEQAYVPLLTSDYGIQSISKLDILTSTIQKIYKHIRISNFDTITVYSSFSAKLSLKNIDSLGVIEINDLTYFVTVTNRNIIVEVGDNGDIFLSYSQKIDMNKIRANAIVYKYENGKDIFLGRTEERFLVQVPDSESNFQFKTYKDLEEAFQDYYVKRARLSNCIYLKKCWNDKQRLYFNPGPEAHMRNSLKEFLEARLRGNPEVMIEQNVDESHPVDIKVSWRFSSHIAIIEIKWLGVSYNDSEGKLSTPYSDARANSGAKQLVEYLDSIETYASTKLTSGYLVVFDGRRKGISGTYKSTCEIVNGLHYKSLFIHYDPQYDLIRRDFEKPVRFFLEPNISP